jgi:hypothetical protein
MSSVYENKREFSSRKIHTHNSENIYLHSEENKNNNASNLTNIPMKNKIELLNKVYFKDLICGIINKDEQSKIEENYLNQERFNSIFEETDHLEFNYLMAYLQYNSDIKNVMFGLRETMKSIESNRAKLVYIANDCEVNEYEKLLKELCDLNNVTYIIVPTWIYIRDVLFKGPTSKELISLENEKKKKAKIQPKCNSAAVLYTIEEINEFKFKQKIAKDGMESGFNFINDSDNDKDNEYGGEDFDDKIYDNIK